MMSSKNKINRKYIFLLLFLFFCSVSCYLILYRPIPRQIGLTFRNTLYVFPLVFIFAFLFGHFKTGLLHTIMAAVLFAFTLFPYSGMINSGLSDQYALGGVIPWSDAFTMQLNTQRFLYGWPMGQATALRPIYTVYYAVFLWLFNNDYFALQVFICICTALCLLILLKSVADTFGSVCGAFCYTVLFFYMRQRLGTFMTEPYGFICGILSGALILKGISEDRQWKILLGFLLLSIGLNARPAAMFLFPAVGLWYFFIFLKGNKKRFRLAAFALLLMLFGFALNSYTQIIVYGPEPIPNRQAAEMVYGLCRGGRSWGEVVALPEMTALADSRNVIKDLTGLCAPLLKEHPENILISLKRIFLDSLILSRYYGAFSFMNGNPERFAEPFRYVMMLIWCLGIGFCCKKRKEPKYSLLLWSACGIIISECFAVPFSTNYLRLYAVSMWVPACICGLFPQYCFSKIFPCVFTKQDQGHLDSAIMAFSAGLFVVPVLIGPAFIKAHPLEKPEKILSLCSADEDVLITSVDPGSFIYLEEKDMLSSEHIPYFRLPYVRQHIHDTASIEMFDFTDSINEPTAIIRGIDLGNGMDALIFSPLALVQNKIGRAQFCGKFIDPPVLRNDRFFIPTTVTFFEDGL